MRMGLEGQDCASAGTAARMPSASETAVTMPCVMADPPANILRMIDWSVRLYPGRFQHAVPARHLGADVRRSLLGPRTDRVRARGGEAFEHALVFQRLLRRLVETVDD